MAASLSKKKAHGANLRSGRSKRRSLPQWWPDVSSVLSHTVAAAAVAGAGWLAAWAFRVPLVPLVVAHPVVAVVVTAAAGSLATLGITALIRRLSAPRHSEYPRVHTQLPNDPGGPQRIQRLAVIQEAPLTWQDFEFGLEMLRAQLNGDSWTPDLVVAINEGHVITGLLRSSPRLRAARLGSIYLDQHRNPVAVTLPPKSDFNRPIKTLVVDYQLKRGGAVRAVAELLADRLGVTVADTRVAVMVLGELDRIAAGDGVHQLSSDAFMPKYDFTSERAAERVNRLFYLAFMCEQYPTPPWRSKENA